MASGTSTRGFQPVIIIYNLNLVQVARLDLNPSDTASLAAGDYYFEVSTRSASDGGTFTFTSTLLAPGCGAPSPDYTAGYNAGEIAGEKAGGGFYVIPIPARVK